MTIQREKWSMLMERSAQPQRQAMGFLWDHLPDCDLDCYPPDLFLRFVQHALALRETAPWCACLDWEIFAHYVLFPRVNDEDLSFHRDVFHRALWPRVKDLPSQEERISEVNRWCHEHASYQAQDERTASPLTVYRCGSGRCGEESAFLVSALRSVGIPARQVYAPRWSHCDDNHAWVEALCGDRWRFLGACEPEPVLDRGWFTTAASRAVLVHSRIFGTGTSPLHGGSLGPDGAVSWFDQTARYAETRSCSFQAFIGGLPAAGARFHLQILNEASFRTIAVLTADEHGRAQAQLGMGSLHVLASKDDLAAEGDLGDDELVLHLAPPGADDVPWTDLDFHAPADRRPAPALLSSALKAERARIRSQGNARRQAYLAWPIQPCPPEWEDLLKAARGNHVEIAAFLAGADPRRRELLLRTLADKDLRDVTQEILEDHLSRLPPRPDGLPEEIYWQYVACPRLALEKLTAWRGPLDSWLSGWSGDPIALHRRICEELELCEGAYSNLYWAPEAALTAGRCDERSRRSLLVAALRTLGVPARLRPLDGAVEYWADGGFRPVLPEETGVLRLTAPAGRPLRYRLDWTISRWETDGWRLLAPTADWKDGGALLELPAGRYRILTSVRLPGGNQLASRRELTLDAGGERTVPVRMRSWTLDDLFSSQELPALPAETLDGQHIPDLSRMGSGTILALWLEEGGEPTEHLLNELMEHRQTLEGTDIQVLFLLKGRDSLTQPTLAKALALLPQVQVLLDDWAYDLESVARHLGRDPDAPPLAVVCTGAGRAIYSHTGYRVGSAELLLQVAAAVQQKKSDEIH